jgi:shikimate dehydrogenase
MRPEQITRETRLFGLVGDALEKTPLPAMFNAFYDGNALDAFCSIFNIREEDVPFFLTNIKSKPIGGLFIQPSHREFVLPYIDRFFPDFEASGAVDSIIIDAGMLWGTCFQAEGIADELAAMGQIRGKTVALIGCNAQALATALCLIREFPARMIVADASREEALVFSKKIEALSGFASFGIERCAAGVKTDLLEADAVINFAALEADAVFLDLKPGAIVYDAEGSLAGLSWQKEVRYKGPYYMNLLQAKMMSDRIFGIESQIDEKYMESAEIIEIF